MHCLQFEDMLNMSFLRLGFVCFFSSSTVPLVFAASPITSDISESNLDSDDDSECTISAYSDNGNLGLSKRVTRSSKRICTRKGVIGKGGKMRLREAGGGGASSKEVGRASQSRRTLSKVVLRKIRWEDVVGN